MTKLREYTHHQNKKIIIIKKERKKAGLGYGFKENSILITFLPSSSFPHNVHCPDCPSSHFQE
jgi:hypothetical protein